MLNVAHAWYTNQVVNGRLTIPPKDIDRSNAADAARLETDSPAFRGKKGNTVFGHLRALFRHEEMQRLIVRNPQMFTRTVYFLKMFVGLQTQQKEHGEHVEYEVEWPRSFAILGELAKCCRELGEAFQYAEIQQLLGNIVTVSNRVLRDMMLMSHTLDPEKYARPVETDVLDVLVHGSRFTLIKEDVSVIRAFSFHHYMNLLFAEMIKSLRKSLAQLDLRYRQSDLRYTIESSVLQSTGTVDCERMKLMLIEYPMQS